MMFGPLGFSFETREDAFFSYHIVLSFHIFLISALVYAATKGAGPSSDISYVLVAIMAPFLALCDYVTYTYYIRGLKKSYDEAYEKVVALGVETNDTGYWCSPFNVDLAINFYETVYSGKYKDIYGKTFRDAKAQLNGKYTCATVLRHASLEDREIAFDKRYQARQTCGFW